MFHKTDNVTAKETVAFPNAFEDRDHISALISLTTVKTKGWDPIQHVGMKNDDSCTRHYSNEWDSITTL